MHDAAFRNAVTRTLAALPRTEVPTAASYWTTGSAQFVGDNGHATYVALQLAGGSDSARLDTYAEIQGKLAAPGLTSQVGGQVPTYSAINKEVKADIGRAEAISLPVLLVLLLVIFGSLAAASLPLAIGGIGILGSFAALRLLTLVTGVSIYSINITTILGLGLAIDYGLFMVSRFREELHRQPTTEDAVARTVATAGRTVAVSGVTVAVALAGLMLFPETFLRSMGYGGVATVVVDMLAALTVMPALLAVLGPRVNALRVRRAAARPRPARAERRLVPAGPQRDAPARRLRRGDCRRAARPGRAVPAHHLGRHRRPGAARGRPGPGGDRGAEPGLPRQPGQPDRGDHEAGRPGRGPGPAGRARLRTCSASSASRVSRRPSSPGSAGTTVRIDLRYAADPSSVTARQLVTAVRAVPAPAGSHVYVGGVTAQLVDELASLGHTLPWMALVICLATFVLLFLAFGSVVLPVKAILMNALSLSATFGVIVWIFQEGHLSGLLRFTPTGTIDPAMPILLLAIVFGLSMDYEVFLLSRIRERYDVTGDNTAAIASGLQRTGGLITSLALMLVIVVGAFSASGITFIKLLGVGMIVALIVDATIVRVLLVPATMRLLGRANWWAPGPLGRVYRRYGIREQGAPQPVAEPVRS